MLMPKNGDKRLIACFKASSKLFTIRSRVATNSFVKMQS
jgi:hypothetical protein